jgi:PKD repeat protein
MACTKSSNAGASSDLLIMTKRAPSYLSGDLTGVWHSHSLATGASQWWSSGVLTFLTGGFFNGSGTGYGGGTWDTSGVASISTSGLVIHTDDFTATPVLGGAPLIVNFTDATVHNPTSWLWQFDDGTTSTEQNPMHIFTLAGSYDVALTAITAGVPVFVTKTGFINVSTCGAKPVNRSASFYDLIYDGCHYASVNGQTLQMQGIILIQNPVLDNNYAIKLIGGYDCIYSSNPGWTTINGKLTIKGKSVIVEKVKIK